MGPCPKKDLDQANTVIVQAVQLYAFKEIFECINASRKEQPFQDRVHSKTCAFVLIIPNSSELEDAYPKQALIEMQLAR